MSWQTFLAGLLLGWLLEFAIDFFFWRPRRACSDNEQELEESLVLLQNEVARLRRQLAHPRQRDENQEEEDDEDEEKEEPDDLRRIWGIGPKVATLLYLRNIKTFAQLAQLDHDALAKILDDAGSRFRISKENVLESWQEQAAMAAAGNWEALQHYQSKLGRVRAGRRRQTVSPL
jgi:predicted flap endonuclease-1-like 5' DNA nuclease